MTALPIIVIPDWVDLALCAQTDPELFFPEKGGSTRDAKRICQRCPVQPSCLQYALDHDERFGIWGGVSERDRRALKKKTTTTEEIIMTTTDPVDDFEVCEDCYASVDPDDVDSEGRCLSCAAAPAPPHPVKVVGRPTLPGWAYDAAQLLVATEGHQDLLVRDVRKIAAQSLQALKIAKDQYDRLASSTEAALKVVHHVKVPEGVVTSDVARQIKKEVAKRDPLATTVLMQEHGITPADVRAWAADAGIKVAPRGNPARSVIEQYIATTKEN